MSLVSIYNICIESNIVIINTPGTAGGPGGRDRTLAVKSRKNVRKQNKYFFLHISSSYAKILGDKLFHTWEIPRSGSKAEDGGKRKRERETLNNGDNNGQAMHGARMAHAWRTHGARMAHASHLGQKAGYFPG